MAGKIPDETLQAIRERVSIVEVVSGHMTLKKAGRNYVGLCPFHTEKTPSFTVSDERGLFHCFGCGAGGTVFTFLMRIDRVDFVEAVENLARRAGVTLPAVREGGLATEQRQELLATNETAQAYFRSALAAPGATPARQYLAKRGVSRAAIERYGLGYCPPTGAGLACALANKRNATQKAVELGLIGRRADGRFYDRFWGRITFPIRLGTGQLVGFGGRTLADAHPKYLNSPESNIFHKGQVLYGLFEAREAIRQAERVVIVEGYLDALALAEAGIVYAVASLGTALSAAQLRLARRFAPEVIAFFDGDRAGQQAAVRAFSICAEVGVWGLGAFLPQGFDPDAYVRAHGVEATRSLLEKAIPLADFFLERLDPGPDASLPQRTRAAEEIARVIGRISNPLEFSSLASKAAERLRVDEAVFRHAVPRASASSPPAPPGTAPAAAAFRPAETALLEAMALSREAALLAAQRRVLDLFHSAELAAAGRAIVSAWEREQSSAAVLDTLPAGIGARVAAGLLGEGAIATADPLRVATDCIGQVERFAQRSEQRRLTARLKQAETVGDEGVYREQLGRKNAQLRRKELDHG